MSSTEHALTIGDVCRRRDRAPLVVTPRRAPDHRAPGPLPEPAPLWCRVFKHPRLMHYHRLILLMFLVNLGVFAYHADRGDWRIDDGSALSALSALTLVNLAAAVLIRQQHVLNVLFWLAGRGSRSWPLRLRWTVSKIYHVGGIHAGGAVAGTAWLAAFTAVAVVARLREPSSVPLATVLLAGSLMALSLVVVVCALPVVRARAHDVFEVTHRFGGWSAVALFWALIVQVEISGRGSASVAGALLASWQVWVLVVLTASIASPWLRLRRVPVTVERPSSHAVIVRLDYGVTPAVASAVGISRNPLREWHSFATVKTPDQSGYRLLISRAGDWTGAFIDDPPSHVWVRGVPTSAPLAKVEVLYERVLYVVTGSGIGPCLGQILSARVPARLVWSARSPRATYGDALVDEVESAQPDAVIWDTTQAGKPDLVRLAYEAYEEFGADAVFVVSNKATTWRVVHGMERLGIPAFGPIWDS